VMRSRLRVGCLASRLFSEDEQYEFARAVGRAA
jgi:hypothetical protein